MRSSVGRPLSFAGVLAVIAFIAVSADLMVLVSPVFGLLIVAALLWLVVRRIYRGRVNA